MPVEIRDVDGGLGNRILLSGVVTESEFLETMQTHLTQDPEKYRRYRFSVTDMSDVTELNLSTAAIQGHARACVRSAEVNPDAVVAVVATRDLDFGLSRMWELLVGEIPWEIGVFRDGEKAETWVRKRVEERWGLTELTMGDTDTP